MKLSVLLTIGSLSFSSNFYISAQALIRGSTVIDDCKTNQWQRSTRLKQSGDRGSDKCSPGPILGDLGADSGGEGKSKRAEK